MAEGRILTSGIRSGSASDVFVKFSPVDANTAAEIARIYNQGIAERIATFETEPRTPAQLRAQLEANYRAVLPWTRGATPGGRFVNEVPLPAVVKARWLSWIEGGAPLGNP